LIHSVDQGNLFNFQTYEFGRSFEILLNHKCDKCVDSRRGFKDDISVICQLFAPAVAHMSVECVLRLMGDELHLPLQVRAVLGLITCGLESLLISVSSVGGA